MTMDTSLYAAWAHSAEETLEHHAVDQTRGLDEAEVAEKRELYGYNELKKPPPPSMWALILEQFDDTLVKVRGSLDGCNAKAVLVIDYPVYISVIMHILPISYCS